jgi:hypothetical protein
MPFDSTPVVETKADPAAAVLRGAADAIRRYGWRQRTFGDKLSGFCVIGAIGFALNHTVNPGVDSWEKGILNCVALCRLSRALARRNFGDMVLGTFIAMPPSVWNDLRTTTAAQVIELLEEAADAV